MQIKIFFSESEFNHPDFDSTYRLLKKALDCFFKLSPISNARVTVFKGVPDETQKEKACNKSVRKQRRNKTLNASKSS